MGLMPSDFIATISLAPVIRPNTLLTEKSIATGIVMPRISGKRKGMPCSQEQRRQPLVDNQPLEAYDKGENQCQREQRRQEILQHLPDNVPRQDVHGPNCGGKGKLGQGHLEIGRPMLAKRPGNTGATPRDCGRGGRNTSRFSPATAVAGRCTNLTRFLPKA